MEDNELKWAPKPPPGFHFSTDAEFYDFIQEQFNFLKYARDLRFFGSWDVSSEADKGEFLEKLVSEYKFTLYSVARWKVGNLGNRVYYNQDMVIKASLDTNNNFYFSMAASSEAGLIEFAEWLEKNLPKVPKKDPGVIPVKFWTMTAQGPRARMRDINVPRWSEVAANYPNPIRGKVEEVMNFRMPTNAGRLLLWHGIPGTGKTHSIRALIKEWAPWCNTNYIVDPEKFFGSAEYMMSVLLDQNHTDPNFSEEQQENAVWGDERWILLVIEDAEEFLVAKEIRDTGQSLSRLLNLADGLIGQGINLLILITTNEKIGKIHPAISRDGRCISTIDFPAFDQFEAKAWLAEHGIVESLSTEEKTLAQMYATLREIKQVKHEAPAVRAGTYL